MKKYLNKYTVIVLVILAIAAGIGINIHTDRAYLAKCLDNQTFDMYIVNEYTKETVANNFNDWQYRHLSAEEERQIMEYLRALEVGNAYSSRQRAGFSLDENRWYSVFLHLETQGTFYFSICDYERNNYVECSKFVRKLDFNLEFMNYLDSLFVSERSG